jgi:hypothetical protein
LFFKLSLLKLSELKTLLKEHKVITGICMPKSLKEIVDIKRGDVPRSVYISKILEKNCKGNEKEDTTCNKLSDQWGLSRRQPREGPTDPSARSTEWGGTNG